MHRMFMLLGLVLAVVLLAACGRAGAPVIARMSRSIPDTPVIPPPGFLYERVSAPLSVNYHQTPAEPGRTGISKSRYFSVPIIGGGLLSFGWGDASVEEAAIEGRLREVEYADYEVMQLLTIYTEFTVIAHGR